MQGSRDHQMGGAFRKALNPGRLPGPTWAAQLVGMTDLPWAKARRKSIQIKDVLFTNEPNKLVKTKGNCKKTNPNEAKSQ